MIPAPIIGQQYKIGAAESCEFLGVARHVFCWDRKFFLFRCCSMGVSDMLFLEKDEWYSEGSTDWIHEQ